MHNLKDILLHYHLKQLTHLFEFFDLHPNSCVCTSNLDVVIAVDPNPTTCTGDGSVDPIPAEVEIISYPVPSDNVLMPVCVFLNVSNCK